ncbi:hypothetical protein BBR47_51620 [Brevibacillus brevis NBRC 100599]|uniref:Uncharacterized protein n=1 Tax=Brevibacillus brevis (strain 47 / JCM 6285 / NBRC 100599) TaxID=358681 RepID=C0Z5N3_BREBN|nr:hypothetical protein BBR47_51620 [Brevibacillus brevis NBRC 100599]
MLLRATTFFVTMNAKKHSEYECFLRVTNPEF